MLYIAYLIAILFNNYTILVPKLATIIYLISKKVVEVENLVDKNFISTTNLGIIDRKKLIVIF